jgi:hypothetical protein
VADLVLVRDSIDVGVQGQHLEDTDQDGRADGQIARFESTERGPGHESTRRHLRRAHAAPQPRGLQPITERLGLSLRVGE